MIKLTKHSLTPVTSFFVETESMTLAEKDSSVTFTVALPAAGESAAPLPDAPSLTIGDWLMEDTEPGKGIVWRVKSIEDDYSKRTRTVTAEHIIQILKDTCIFGEKGPEDMGGSETMVDAQHAIQFALGAQSDWVLGTFTYTSVSAGYTFNSDSVLEAINTVSTTLQDCWWSYKLDVYPFQLNIQPKANTASCEMRMSRNITTIKRSLDASQLYTRIFPIGKDDLHLTETYLSKNTSIYGVIHKVETNQSLESETELRAWAQELLNRHSEPNLTISVTGLELSDATGEPMDHLAPGRLCQVPLPEYSTVITETITKMVWRDKLKAPRDVTVTMANQPTDLATIIKEQNDTNTGGSGSGGRRAGSSSKKEKEEDHAWMVDTTDHVGLVAEAVAGEGAASDWSRVAEVMVDGEGVHQRVTRTENDLVTAEAAIDVLEDSISLKVTKGDVSTELAVECGNVSITGGNLVVDGYVTSAGLSSAIADIATLMVQDINGASALFEGDVGADGLYVSTIELNGYQVNIVDAELSVDGKSLIISKADGTSVTFSKATTQSPSWSGSTLSVNAQQTNGGTTSTVATHLVELGGNYTSGRTTLEFVNDGQAPTVTTVLGVKTLTVPLKVRSLNGGSTTPTTRLTTSISCNPATVLESKTGTSKITANGTYYPGTNYIGFDAVEIDVQGGMTASGLVIDTTNHEIRTSTTSTVQNVAIASTVSLLYNSSTHKYTATGEALANGTTIHAATAVVSGTQAYNAGWGDAYADVSLPTTNPNSASFIVQTPSSTVGGTPVSTTYTIEDVTGNNNMVQVRSNSGTIVARHPHNKYNAGFNAVGSPTITWPSTITTGTREDSISIKAAVDAKTTGTARSTTMQLSIGQSTFTTSGGITGYPCVNLYSAPNQGGNIIGRSDCGAIHNNGGKTAWLYRLTSGSTWTKVTSASTLGYGQTLRVRYTAANKNIANVTDAVFYTPTLNLQAKDVTVGSTTTIYPDSGYDGLSSVIVRPAHQSYFTLTRGTKIQDNVYQYTVTLGSNVTGNAQTFTVYY